MPLLVLAYCDGVGYPLLHSWISLSTVVLNSMDRHEKHGVPLLCTSITRLTMYFTQKHRLKYIGNTIITLYLCKNLTNAICREFLKLSDLPVFHLTAGLPAIRPTSTRSMAPDFSHNKGNRVRFTKMLFR